jgi:hypothetical protein
MEEPEPKDRHEYIDPNRGQDDLQGAVVKNHVRLVEDPNEREKDQRGGDDAGHIALELDGTPDMLEGTYYDEPDNITVPEIIVIKDGTQEADQHEREELDEYADPDGRSQERVDMIQAKRFPLWPDPVDLFLISFMPHFDHDDLFELVNDEKNGKNPQQETHRVHLLFLLNSNMFYKLSGSCLHPSWFCMIRSSDSILSLDQSELLPVLEGFT